MAERPFIFLPPPEFDNRQKLPGGGSGFRKPSPSQQRPRLNQRFETIALSFRGLQADIQGIEPEQVIVLETVTASVERVANAAKKIPGLEWLAELDLGELEPDYGFEDEQNPVRGPFF